MSFRIRYAVRALVVTPRDEVLLLRTRSRRGRVFWLTPGGGIEDDESPLEALRRELWEETGFELTERPTPVWRRSFRYASILGPTEQRETFFLVRAPRFSPTFSNLPDPDEQAAVLEGRWWSREALRLAAGVEDIAPAELPTHIGSWVEAEPLLVGW